MSTDVKLLKEDLALLVRLLKDNVYITQFEVGSHPQLNQVKVKLHSTLARNQWLQHNGYLPPLVDNYWAQAAKYWLYHLPEQEDLLLPNTDIEFKHSVRDMGLDGLTAVLDYLAIKNNQAVLNGMYGRHKPRFYAACLPKELSLYLQKLSAYLNESTAFFPFSELAITYENSQRDQFVQLCHAVQQSATLDKFTLLQASEGQVSLDFLQELCLLAKQESWTVLIHIPDLEDSQTLNNNALRYVYAQLNNQIILNRHQAEKPFVEQLATLTEINITQSQKPQTAPRKPPKPPKPHAKRAVAATHVWPLQKTVGLQQQQQQEQQQQQQMEQVQEIKQEQQVILPLLVEEPLTDELIHYDNIDTMLNAFYEEHQRQHPIDSRFATLQQQQHESILKGFFRTWVSAKIEVKAPHVIQKMTPDAAKMLLKNHQKFTSGIQLDNLPRGFYTQLIPVALNGYKQRMKPSD